MNSPSKFSKYVFESSNPEILSGEVVGNVLPGSYEFEVEALAKADKHLDVGFPDKNETPVGFGYLGIENAKGKIQDVTIEPGSTLNDVVSQINTNVEGVKASVINTGFAEDPYRLLVRSVESGTESRITIDPDTTFLEFDHIKRGRNLAMKLDDVDITRTANEFNDLIEGVQLNAKNAAPGTMVQVNIKQDIDKTAEGIKGFTEKYNQILKMAHDNTQYVPGQQGPLQGSAPLRDAAQQLQRKLSSSSSFSGSRYSSLAQIGITTNAKTGELMVDDAKLKQAMTKDYDGVTKIFAASEQSDGLANVMAKTIRHLKDPQAGAVGSRIKSLDQMIQNADKDVERQARMAEAKEERIRRQFQELDSHLAGLNQQDAFLSSQMPQGQGPKSN